MSPLTIARLALGGWGVFDVATGLGALFAPDLVAGMLQTSASADALVMFRRAGAYWAFLGIVQLAAAMAPTRDRLRLAGVFRVVDGFADIAWLAAGPAFTTQGWLTIGVSPPLCFAVGWLAFRAASALPAR